MMILNKFFWIKMAVIGLTASTIAARTYSVVSQDWRAEVYEQVASRGKEEIIEVGNLLWNDEVARQNNGVKEVKFKKAKLRKKETPDNWQLVKYTDWNTHFKKKLGKK